MQYCEGLKRDPAAPLYGYFLAHKNNHQPDVVRHFGLSLIEDAVRYRWSDGALTPEIKVQIRINTMSLAAEVGVVLQIALITGGQGGVKTSGRVFSNTIKPSFM